MHLNVLEHVNLALLGPNLMCILTPANLKSVGVKLYGSRLISSNYSKAII